MRSAFLIVIFTGSIQLSLTQTNFLLFDVSTKTPVADAFAFIDKTTYSAISQKDGQLTLVAGVHRSEILHVSHLNYQFYSRTLKFLKEGDTIWLKPSNHELEVVNVVGKGKNKRKSWLRRFENDLLGTNKKKYDVSIVNPGDILFREEKGGLKAESSKAIIIRNEHLKYDIRYWLEDYTSHQDGTIQYHDVG